METGMGLSRKSFCSRAGTHSRIGRFGHRIGGRYRSFLAASEVGLSDVAGYIPGGLHERNQRALPRSWTRHGSVTHALTSTTCGEEVIFHAEYQEYVS